MRPSSRCRPAATLVLSAALLLTGCGGGVSIGWGDGIGGDRPDVSVSVSVTSAEPGQLIRVGAVASDDDGIDYVAFYREDDDGVSLLDRDGSRPYGTDTRIPIDARGSVDYFALAVDVFGRERESSAVTVTIR